MNTFKIWLLQKFTSFNKKECTKAFHNSNQSFTKARARLTCKDLSAQELQVVFNLVINSGYYTADSTHRNSGFMCLALCVAQNEGIITMPENWSATKHIREYIHDHYALVEYLYWRKLDNSSSARMAIYKNWANRP